MNYKLVFSFIVLALLATASLAQNDLQIRKKVTRTLPGMMQISTEQLTPEMKQQMKEINDTKTTVYIKGSWMRTDTTAKAPKMTGGLESHTFSTVMQCDKQRVINFDTKSKKYYQYSMNGQTKAKTGGLMTVSGSVTDTGERAKLFGFDVRRLKQTFVFTPSATACRKQKFQIEIDGWYADLPEFSCPVRMALPEDEGDCFDDFDYQIKGAVNGVAFKEIKKITMDGQTVTMDEEATEVKRTTLVEAFFEPPAGYKAGSSQFNSSDNSRQTSTGAATFPVTTTTPVTASSDSAPLPLPAAGLQQPQPLGEKKPGTIRIGIAKPKVTIPDSKNDPSAGSDIVDAVTKSLVESLKAETVEAVALETDSFEAEAKSKDCDYIFYANVTQKRGGGGMFGKMLAMGAASMAGAMLPGIGGMIASTVGSVAMGQTMGKAAKAKDEFTFDYRAVGLDNAVLAKGVTKDKTKKDGEDVLTPQIKTASTAVLGEIAKKKSVGSP